MKNGLPALILIHHSSISWRQFLVTEPDRAIARHGTFPHGAALRPTFRVFEQAFEKAFGHPPRVNRERQIQVNECICRIKSLPGRGNTSEAIDDPGVLFKDICMGFEIFLVGHRFAARAILDQIECNEGETRFLGEIT